MQTAMPSLNPPLSINFIAGRAETGSGPDLVKPKRCADLRPRADVVVYRDEISLNGEFFPA